MEKENLKYELTDDYITVNGQTLYRIRALKSFCAVTKGDLGGYVNNDSNLSQEGNCWIYTNAKALDYSRITDNALLAGNAEAHDFAKIRGNAHLYDNAIISDNALLEGNAYIVERAKVMDCCVIPGETFIRGDVVITQDEDYLILKNNWSSMRYFTYTHPNRMWSVGCFYGTGDELIAKAYLDSKRSGDCYKASVEYVKKLFFYINRM